MLVSQPLDGPARKQLAELRRFEQLLIRCERFGRSRIGFDALQQLGRLYRLHAAALARARHRGDDPELTRALNAVCVRAYTALYASSRRGGGRPASRVASLADALARTWRFQILAWALLLAGGLVGVLVARDDPAALPALVPPGLGHSESSLEALVSAPEERARFLAREETPAARNTLFGSWLFAHNVQVGLVSFATGILAGIPTVLLQLYNGIVLGSFAWIFLRDPSPWPFLAWILPHAVPELTAITLCAAGGLVLGDAVATPGRQGRRRRLRAAADPALLLFGLAIPLLALAAAMESFVRESALSTATRLGVAALELALLLASLLQLRRMARRRDVDRSWLSELAAPGAAEAAAAQPPPEARRAR
jgi:uncharacterized membrane protein SpoIIM required for sporulation